MQYLTKRIIVFGAFALVLLIPIVLWSVIEPLSYRFGTTITFFSSLGKLAGIVGITLFAVTLVLATRLPLLDRCLKGLTEVHLYHHYLGAFSFLFILAHPLLMLVQYLAISVPAAALFLLPGGGLEKDLGIYALLGMIAVMMVTLFARLIYQIKLTTHKMFGVIFVLASFHMLLISSDVSSYTPLKVYMFGIVVLGTAAYAYRLFLDYFPIRKYVYTITALTRGEGIVEIKMKPQGASMAYVPGQFMFVHFESKGVTREVHPFSISSGGEDELSITVKNLGDYTSTLPKLKIGERAYLEGPFGVFNHNQGMHAKQIWIAGGVGITPYLGMVRSFKDKAQEKTIDLYYSVRSRKDLAYLDELQKVARVSKRFRVIPNVSDEQGYLTVKRIRETSGDLNGVDIFLCGPPLMVQNLKEQLFLYKIPKKNIYYEEFVLL